MYYYPKKGGIHINYETLLAEATEQGLIVKEKPLRYNDGRIKGNRIAIRKNIETTTEKACVLLEELGHHYTTVGDILDQSIASNRKQEHRARVWAYRNALGLSDLVSAYKRGCRNCYEIAEHLNITESFLIGAIEDYKAQYGLFAKIDNYIIYFEPLGVLELNI